MAIVCDHCGSAFTVDASLVPAGGARTSCPACGHETVVHPGNVTQPQHAPYAPPFSPPTPFPTDPLQYPGSRQDVPQQYQPDSGRYVLPESTPRQPPLPVDASDPRALGFDSAPHAQTDPLSHGFGATPGPGQVPFPRPQFSQTDPYSRSLPPDPLQRDGQQSGRFAVGSFDEAALASARQRAPSHGAAPQQTAPSSTAPSSTAPDFETLDPPNAPDGSTTASTGGGWSSDSSPPPTEPDADRPPPEARDGEWYVRKPDGSMEGPFLTHELVARCEAGLVRPGDRVAHGTDPFTTLTNYTLTASFARPSAPAQQFRTYASSDRGPFPWKALAAGITLLVGIATGALVFTSRPASLFGGEVATEDIPTQAILDGWRDTEPTPIASASELFQLARGFHATDTRDSLRRAADTYKRVLLRDRNELRAMAWYAAIRGSLAIDEGDEQGVRESSELLGYALRHGGHLMEPHVARAHLLAATNAPDEVLAAQETAEIARVIAPKDPNVHLAMGHAFLTTNTERAAEFLELAVKAEETSRRALLLLGDAYSRMGRLGEARAVLEKRRRLLPDDHEADLKLAMLDASTGRFDRARRQLSLASRRNAATAEARLIGALLDYQVEGDPRTARRELESLLQKRLGRRLHVRATTHLSAVAFELGELDRSEDIARRGLEIDAESPTLHHRLALVQLTRGDAAKALEHLEKALPFMPDRGQRALLEGRVHAALGDIDRARTLFNRAAFLSPHRAEPHLLEASLYAQLGAVPQALACVRRALDADPAWPRTHRSLTDFFDGNRHLSLVVASLESLAGGGHDPALLAGAVAAAKYQAGDAAGAELAARRAVSGSRATLAGHVHLAQFAIDHRRPREALDHAEAAARIFRHSPVPALLAGRALTSLGRFDDALGRFEEALSIDPLFLPAIAGQAETLAALGDRERALTLYRAAFKTDSDDTVIRRGLDALERAAHAEVDDLGFEVEVELAPEP